MVHIYSEDRDEYLIQYQEGRYDQSQLRVRKRLKDEDVATFLMYWLQGRAPVWIGKQLTSPTGAALGYQMVRQHAKRLGAQGLLDDRWADEQPDWKAYKERHNRAQPLEITKGQRFQPYKGLDVLPKGLRPTRGGRPTKGTARRGRPPANSYTRPEDLMRGVDPNASQDGPLVVPYFDPNAEPPEGYEP